MGKHDLIFERNGLRELDRRAVEEFHIPILVLMENAGRAVAEAAKRYANVAGKVLLLIGPGNNGGDGLVAARHLHNAGINVTMLLLAGRDRYKDAAAVQMATIDAMKLPVEVASQGHVELRDWLVDASPDDLIIDAIFGTGLSRHVEGIAAEVIAAVNLAGHPVLAVDIPSGLDCDSGEPAGQGVVIHATETVSFCGLKKGFGKARKYTGKVTVADIGAPVELLRALAMSDPSRA